MVRGCLFFILCAFCGSGYAMKNGSDPVFVLNRLADLAGCKPVNYFVRDMSVHKLRAGFKNLAIVYHPDKCELRDFANKAMSAIEQAKNKLMVNARDFDESFEKLVCKKCYSAPLPASAATSRRVEQPSIKKSATVPARPTLVVDAECDLLGAAVANFEKQVNELFKNARVVRASDVNVLREKHANLLARWQALQAFIYAPEFHGLTSGLIMFIDRLFGQLKSAGYEVKQLFWCAEFNALSSIFSKLVVDTNEELSPDVEKSIAEVFERLNSVLTDAFESMKDNRVLIPLAVLIKNVVAVRLPAPVVQQHLHDFAHHVLVNLAKGVNSSLAIGSYTRGVADDNALKQLFSAILVDVENMDRICRESVHEQCEAIKALAANMHALVDKLPSVPRLDDDDSDTDWT